MVAIYVEAQDGHRIVREVGIDASRRVVHRYPDGISRRGGEVELFLMKSGLIRLGVGVEKSEFEEVWALKSESDV